MISRTIWRAFRSAIAVGAGVALKTFFDNPALIWAAPIINAIGKYIRDKYPEKFDWLPF
jgi:hypothetical protein